MKKAILMAISVATLATSAFAAQDIQYPTVNGYSVNQLCVTADGGFQTQQPVSVCTKSSFDQDSGFTCESYSQQIVSVSRLWTICDKAKFFETEQCVKSHQEEAPLSYTVNVVKTSQDFEGTPSITPVGTISYTIPACAQ